MHLGDVEIMEGKGFTSLELTPLPATHPFQALPNTRYNLKVFRSRRIRVIGVPFGLGGKRIGASLGPSAVRLAGLHSRLEKLVGALEDEGDVWSGPLPAESKRGKGIAHFDSVLENLKQVKQAVTKAFTNQCLPLIIGGDHSLAIATVSAALEAVGREMGLLWVDAHLDLNTPDTSPSGNLHGMPVAGLCRYPCGPAPEPMETQWSRLLSEVVPEPGLDPDRVLWFGVRDPDPGERVRILEGDAQRVVTMHEIDRYGLAVMVEHLLKVCVRKSVKKLWISFDVDVLDPFIAPGTGTDVRGGLTYREAHLLAEMLFEAFSQESPPIELVGIDIAEVNPILDSHNETAQMAVDWITSLMGKRIMPRLVL